MYHKQTTFPILFLPIASPPDAAAPLARIKQYEIKYRHITYVSVFFFSANQAGTNRKILIDQILFLQFGLFGGK